MLNVVFTAGVFANICSSDDNISMVKYINRTYDFVQNTIDI